MVVRHPDPGRRSDDERGEYVSVFEWLAGVMGSCFRKSRTKPI
jgi:hypothetical protein